MTTQSAPTRSKLHAVTLQIERIETDHRQKNKENKKKIPKDKAKNLRQEKNSKKRNYHDYFVENYSKQRA